MWKKDYAVNDHCNQILNKFLLGFGERKKTLLNIHHNNNFFEEVYIYLYDIGFRFL